ALASVSKSNVEVFAALDLDRVTILVQNLAPQVLFDGQGTHIEFDGTEWSSGASWRFALPPMSIGEGCLRSNFLRRVAENDFDLVARHADLLKGGIANDLADLG